MHKPFAACFGLSLPALAASCLSLQAEHPTWSKSATVLDLRCPVSHRTIASPDHRKAVQVLCRDVPGGDPMFFLRVTTTYGHASQILLPDGARELSWAPSFTTFFINGGTTAYSGFFVDLYTVTASGDLESYPTFTQAAQRDMVATFARCQAENSDSNTCGAIAKNPQYNMSGIRWRSGGSAVDVFAEIPCSSSYGSIMCQIKGYELSVPDGTILKKLNGRQMQRSWRPSMAWTMNTPEPPRFIKHQ